MRDNVCLVKSFEFALPPVTTRYSMPLTNNVDKKSDFQRIKSMRRNGRIINGASDENTPLDENCIEHPMK